MLQNKTDETESRLLRNEDEITSLFGKREVPLFNGGSK
jgi:hypothetical protein